MPKASGAKTESARSSRLPLIISWVVVLLLLAAAMWWYGWSGQTRLAFGWFPTHTAKQVSKPVLGSRVQQDTGVSYATLDTRIGNQEVTLDIADTSAKQTLGLGMRAGMAPDHGMLFAYNQPSDLCFWMKDMKFSIDIIWLDANKQVVKLMDNVNPDTYPETFCPDKPSQYVVELSPGAAKAGGLKLGSELPFDY